MTGTRLNKNESNQLVSYAKALEDQDGMTEDQFQASFGVSKKRAKNNIALCIRTFVENHKL